MDILNRARESAYLGATATIQWDLIQVMARDWLRCADEKERVTAAYLRHHLPAWCHIASIQGAYPWDPLEARLLMLPSLPVPHYPAPIRAAFEQWTWALMGDIVLDRVEGPWRKWVCAWALGVSPCPTPLTGAFAEAQAPRITPTLMVQAAQRCMLRPPDRVVQALERPQWASALGFEV